MDDATNAAATAYAQAQQTAREALGCAQREWSLRQRQLFRDEIAQIMTRVQFGMPCHGADYDNGVSDAFRRLRDELDQRFLR